MPRVPSRHILIRAGLALLSKLVPGYHAPVGVPGALASNYETRAASNSVGRVRPMMRQPPGVPRA